MAHMPQDVSNNFYSSKDGSCFDAILQGTSTTITWDGVEYVSRSRLDKAEADLKRLAGEKDAHAKRLEDQVRQIRAATDEENYKLREQIRAARVTEKDLVNRLRTAEANAAGYLADSKRLAQQVTEMQEDKEFWEKTCALARDEIEIARESADRWKDAHNALAAAVLAEDGDE